MDYRLIFWTFKTGFVSVLSSPDDNWWTGVVWCLYHTLILTAPIHFHCWDTDAVTHFCNFWLNDCFKCRLKQPHKPSSQTCYVSLNIKSFLIQCWQGLSAVQLNTFTDLWTAERFSGFHSAWFFSRKSVRVPLSTGISRYSTPSAPWHTNNAAYISHSEGGNDVISIAMA